MWDYIVPVLTFIAGQASILGGEWFRDVRARDREREARHETSDIERRALHDQFQKETLLELQDALKRYIRAVGAADHQNHMVARQSGNWNPGAWTETPRATEINDALFESDGALSQFASRVDDGQIRDWVSQCRDQRLRQMTTFAKHENDISALALGALGLVIHERIGERLRGLFQAPTQEDTDP